MSICLQSEVAVAVTALYDFLSAVQIKLFSMHASTVLISYGFSCNRWSGKLNACRADGRTIQAVEAVNDPHRVHNHNFTAWESWEQHEDELVNAHWKHKASSKTSIYLSAGTHKHRSTKKACVLWKFFLHFRLIVRCFAL